MGINKINIETTWSKAAGDINGNFDSINADLVSVKNATTNNKGYFSNSDALRTMFPSGRINQIAYVGSSYPYAIWKWNGSQWYNTGQTGGSESVNLGDYHTAEYVDAKLADLASEVGLVKSVTNIFTKVSEKNNVDNSYAGDFVDVKLSRNEDVYNGVNIVLCREFYNRSKRLFFNHYDGSRSQGTLVFDSNGIAQIDINESVDNAVIADFNAELKTTIYVYSNPQQYFNEKLAKDVDDKLNKGFEGTNMLLEYMMENLSQAAWVSKLPNNSKLQNSVGNNIITSGAYFNLPINPYSQSFDLKLEFDIIFDSTSIQYEGHPNFYWWSINNMVLRGENWVGKTRLEVGKKYNITLNYLRYSGKIQVFIDGVIEAETNVIASINTNINFQLFGLEKGNNNTYGNIVARRKRIKVYINEELKHNLYAIELDGRYGYYDSVGALCYFSESDVEFIKG